MAPRQSTDWKTTTANWPAIISAVITSRHLFALALLALLPIIGVVFYALPPEERSQAVPYAALLIGLLFVAIFVLGYRRSFDDLKSGVPYTVVLAASSKRMPGLDITQISWDTEKCFLNQSGKKFPVVPGRSPAGPSFEIRIDAEILQKISETKPLDIELFDKKGYRWEVRPFFIFHTSAEMHCEAAEILTVYGDGQ